MIIGIVLMSMIIWPYRTGALNIDFLLTKWKIIHLSYFQWSFYIHIVTSLFVLFACPILISSWVLKNYKTLHAFTGRFYVFVVLFLSAPSGLVLAFHANGGILTKVNFIVLSLAWWVTTFIGFRNILDKNTQGHRNWMTRSIALSLSAVTLRFLQMIFGFIPYFEEGDTYLLVSILSWGINVLFAEYSIRKRISIQNFAAI